MIKTALDVNSRNPEVPDKDGPVSSEPKFALPNREGVVSGRTQLIGPLKSRVSPD